MKPKDIKFFSPNENSASEKKVRGKSKPQPTGYISAAGKVVFPQALIDSLGIAPETTKFRIGMDQGKRKIKSLYLVPTTEESDTFSFQKSSRGYIIPLTAILTKGKIDFSVTKYKFSVNQFRYQDQFEAYELRLKTADVRSTTGKRRGRKPKNAVL